MGQIAYFLANALNPLFVVLVIAAPVVKGTRGYRLWLFWLASGAGLAVAVLLAESGKRITHSGFPSGHETFALACGTALVSSDRRWLWAVVPLAVLLGWALVVAGWHRPLEVAGALLTGPPAAFVAQALFRRHEASVR